MIVPEVMADEPAVGDGVPAGPAPRVHGWWLGAVEVLAGAALVLVATMVLDHATGLPRWILGLAGGALAARGADTLGKKVFGPRFRAGLWFSVLWLTVLILLALFANLLPLQGPKALPLRSKSYVRPDLFSSHPLGTDGFGRDYLARLIYGSRISLIIGLGCVAVGGLIGTTVGICAGYYRARIEKVVDVLTDALLAFPPLVFLLALVAVLRPSLLTEFVALGALTVPTFIRLAKANTYVYAQREFVLAARALGTKNKRIIWREIVPNVLAPLFSYAMAIVAALMIAEASLSFLGLGIKPPEPSWGNMIADSQTVLQRDPHAVLLPAIFLFLTVLSFSRLGEVGRTRGERRQTAL